MRDVIQFIGLVFGVIFIGFWTIMFCAWIISGFESKTWNELHGTHYTQSQWFGGSEFIKKYHYPGREYNEKKELNVNVNS